MLVLVLPLVLPLLALLLLLLLPLLLLLQHVVEEGPELRARLGTCLGRARGRGRVAKVPVAAGVAAHHRGINLLELPGGRVVCVVRKEVVQYRLRRQHGRVLVAQVRGGCLDMRGVRGGRVRWHDRGGRLLA